MTDFMNVSFGTINAGAFDFNAEKQKAKRCKIKICRNESLALKAHSLTKGMET